jgi:hypothetical protein
MIQSHTTTDILTNGINQAIMHGAPPDVIANLRGALAFVRHGEAVPKDKPTVVNLLVPAEPAEGVTQDE